MSEPKAGSEPVTSAPRRKKVQSAEVGTDILKGLAACGPSTTLSGLAEYLDMPASKVHRYLQALIASGFAAQDPISGHYTLGREALLLGMAAMRNLDVVKTALPVLADLRARFNETCFLAVWGNQGPSVVHVEKPARAVTVVTQVGSVLPLLSSSTGRVFYAFMSDAETQDLVARERSEGEIPSPQELAAIRDDIRQCGYHAIHGLLMSGVNAISVPVFSLGSRLEGVMTMVGTAPSFNADPQGQAAQQLRAAAEAVSFSLCGEHPARAEP